jgi:pSer/pThr/pTyr-binding forkhead associated (FHA) protein
MFALKLVEVPDGTPTTLVGKVVKLKSLPATMGRGKDATILIQHRKLSRLHCRFYLSEEKLHVRDLGSTNGTTVNGNSVMAAEPLEVGDLVSAGGVVFQVGRFVVNSETDPIGGSSAAKSKPTQRMDSKAKPSRGPIPNVPDAEPSPEFVGTDTVDWRPSSDPEPAVAREQTSEANRLEIEPNDPQDATSQMAPVSVLESEWLGPAKVAPVSAVQIESTFLAKAGTVDAAELPVFAEVPRVEIAPDEIDLADVAEAKKDASVTALGNFFSKQNLRRS